MEIKKDTAQEIKMEKVFNPQAVESKLYQQWEENGYFKAERDPNKTPFTIMMPPPNITGQLHMGHAMDMMPQDALTRYHRMKGDAALWLPGTDHASIATEVKIVEQLAKEGITKEDLGREGYLKRAWEWKDEFGGRIVKQLRKLGSSCDWSRERFTMDAGCNRAVIEVFIKLYEKGLIYRGDRIINWCPECLTAISDAEVEYEEHASHLWYIKYTGKDGQDVVVATTRPETMLGDTGVAVNPNDPRYTNLIGKTVTLPLMNREIPVVADDYVDLEFGTGAVKMTPAHDPNDFEVAQRHNLAILRVMNDDGTMNESAGKYAGLTREECRKQVVKELTELGLLVKIEPYTHNVGACYRCHKTVEPLVSTQWFVKMKPLAEPALDAVRSGEVQFVPERFTKTYYNWMENIRDWCISRQLWWGHRIPAYYCTKCGEMVVSRTKPEQCACGGEFRQDEDVLDTWFSSALWPFSTLGWPEKTEDLNYFYPTNVLVTGYDIIFFWVARMIFSGLENMGEKPFSHVLMHGLVRDSQGRKMSKSLGNGIDPLEMIEKYGADALRFSLAMGVSPGNDVRFSEEKVEANRNFANKIWNASRFALMNLDGQANEIDITKLTMADKWILTKYQEAIVVVTDNLESFDLGMVAGKLYEFAWSEFCDWYIEMAKPMLNGEDSALKDNTRAVLLYVLVGLLKLLHPMMPFITDEVYGNLPGSYGSIMMKQWPTIVPEYTFTAEATQMEAIMEVIRTIRNLRQEMNVSPGRKARLIILPQPGWETALQSADLYFARLASASGVELISDRTNAPQKAASAICASCELFIPLGDLVDVDKELKRLNKEYDGMEKEIARAEGKLNNPGFTSKAPEKLIEDEKEKLATFKTMLSSIAARIEDLKNL